MSFSGALSSGRLYTTATAPMVTGTWTTGPPFSAAAFTSFCSSGASVQPNASVWLMVFWMPYPDPFWV